MKRYIKADENILELSDKITDALEDLGWSVDLLAGRDGEIYAELETWSELGEDVLEGFYYDGTDKDFIAKAIEELSYFDPDEHAELYIQMRGKNGVPESIRDLIDDADSIKVLCDETCEELRKIDL